MRRYITFATLGLLLALMLIGCGNGGSNQNASKPRGARDEYLVLLKTLDNAYFQEMKEGIIDRAAELGIPQSKLIIRSGTGEGDVDAHRRVLNSMIRDRVDTATGSSIGAVLITPASSSSTLLRSLAPYADAGIPIVVVDTPFTDEALRNQHTPIVATVMSSNYDGAVGAARIIHQSASSAQTIFVLNGLDGHETAGQRNRGFVDEVNQLWPESSSRPALIQRSCDWEREKARTTVAALIREHGVPDALFAANDQMALGAVQAIRQAGTDPSTLPIVGFDAIPEARRLVDEGLLRATMAQSPRAMGARALDIAHGVATGHGFSVIITVVAVERGSD